MFATKQSIKKLGLTVLAASALAFSGTASAALFDAGIPVGWTVEGSAGASGADGVVTLAPSGGSQYDRGGYEKPLCHQFPPNPDTLPIQSLGRKT